MVIMCRKNKKGYTLAELLIVVAIIGILVAVSIPIFMSQLRKAKLAVDLANARAGKAAMVAYILTYPEKYIDGNTHTLCYDASTGKVVASVAEANKLTGYGKTTDIKGGDNVDGLLDTPSTVTSLTGCIVTGTFYVDGSTLPSQGDNDDDIITDDRKESSSASTIVGDQIKIMWMRPVDVPTNLGQ